MFSSVRSTDKWNAVGGLLLGIKYCQGTARIDNVDAPHVES